MIVVERNGRRYAQFERLAAAPGLIHAFSTRPNDVSARSDEHAAVRDARRRAMATDWGFAADMLHYCVQAHGPGIAVIDSPRAERRLESIDALVTDQLGAPIMSFSADCPLILVFDSRQRVVGQAHSSWRCTVGFATRGLVETMNRRFGCRPCDLLAGIGPSAGPLRYEVKEDVYDAARVLPDRERFFRRDAGRMYFDLWSANAAQLSDAGVPRSQIEIAGICTMSERELFYSFRREGAGCGHFGLMSGLAIAPTGA